MIQCPLCDSRLYTTVDHQFWCATCDRTYRPSSIPQPRVPKRFYYGVQVSLKLPILQQAELKTYYAARFWRVSRSNPLRGWCLVWLSRYKQPFPILADLDLFGDVQDAREAPPMPADYPNVDCVYVPA